MTTLTPAEIARGPVACTRCGHAYYRPCNGQDATCQNRPAGTAAPAAAQTPAKPAAQPRTTVAKPAALVAAQTSNWPAKPARAPQPQVAGWSTAAPQPLIRSNPEDRREENAPAAAPVRRRPPADVAVGAGVSVLRTPPVARNPLVDFKPSSTGGALRVTFVDGTELSVRYARGTVHVGGSAGRTAPDEEQALLDALVLLINAGAATPPDILSNLATLALAAANLAALSATVCDLATAPSKPAPAAAPAAPKPPRAPRRPKVRTFEPGCAVFAAPAGDPTLYPATLVRELANGDWRVRWSDGRLARVALVDIEWP